MILRLFLRGSANQMITHSMTLKLFGLIPQTTMVNQVWLQYICVPNAALFVSINLK